jgi:hypothetical protein
MRSKRTENRMKPYKRKIDEYLYSSDDDDSPDSSDCVEEDDRVNEERGSGWDVIFKCHACNWNSGPRGCMVCKSCRRCFHIKCLKPPHDDPENPDVWKCNTCNTKKVGDMMRRRELFEGLVIEALRYYNGKSDVRRIKEYVLAKRYDLFKDQTKREGFGDETTYFLEILMERGVCKRLAEKGRGFKWELLKSSREEADADECRLVDKPVKKRKVEESEIAETPSKKNKEEEEKGSEPSKPNNNALKAFRELFPESQSEKEGESGEEDEPEDLNISVKHSKRKVINDETLPPHPPPPMDDDVVILPSPPVKVPIPRAYPRIETFPGTISVLPSPSPSPPPVQHAPPPNLDLLVNAFTRMNESDDSVRKDFIRHCADVCKRKDDGVISFVGALSDVTPEKCRRDSEGGGPKQKRGRIEPKKGGSGRNSSGSKPQRSRTRKEVSRAVQCQGRYREVQRLRGTEQGTERETDND